MPSLLSANSAWQSSYNTHRAQLTDNGRTTANTITDKAAQAVYSANPSDRDHALQAAHDSLSQMSGALGEDNAAVKDLTALVAVAQLQHDRLGGAGNEQVAQDLHDAAQALSPIDRASADNLGTVLSYSAEGPEATNLGGSSGR